jgi:hypothetical protein
MENDMQGNAIQNSRKRLQMKSRRMQGTEIETRKRAKD